MLKCFIPLVLYHSNLPTVIIVYLLMKAVMLYITLLDFTVLESAVQVGSWYNLFTFFHSPLS